VEDAEQLMARGDGDRLGEQVGGGEGVLAPRGQSQELADLAVECAGRAVADAAESFFQELEDRVQRGDIWKGQSSKTPGQDQLPSPRATLRAAARGGRAGSRGDRRCVPSTATSSSPRPTHGPPHHPAL